MVSSTMERWNIPFYDARLDDQLTFGGFDFFRGGGHDSRLVVREREGKEKRVVVVV